MLYKKHAAAGKILSVEKSFPHMECWWGAHIQVIIWPLYLVINELPYNLRMLKENRLFGGLWFGEIKANMQLFLKPLFSELSNLATNGIQINSPFYQNPFVTPSWYVWSSC